MARRNKKSRQAMITAVSVCLLGYGAYRLVHSPAKPPAVANASAAQPISLSAPTSKNTDSRSALEAIEPVAPLVPVLESTTRPVELDPTTRPTVTFASPIAIPSATQALSDAKVMFTAGDLLGARKLANDALASTSLSVDETRSLKAFISDINSTVIFGPRAFHDDSFGGTHTVAPGESMAKIASKYDTTWQMLCRVNHMNDPKRLRAMQTIKIVKGPFHAVVSKSTFTMDIFLGNPGQAGSMYVGTYPVGLGKDDSTPTGTWQVEPHKKIQNPTYFSPRGEGVIAADDPKNPLGEFWIGLVGTAGHALGKTSYGIHGTIEPESIGKMGSLGCIRMRNEDVAVVFDMMVEGKSTIVVKE